MEEEGQGIGEELLSLGLGVGSTRRSNAAVGKRKAKDAEERKLLGLLQAREDMLRVDARRSGPEDRRDQRLVHLLLAAAAAVDAARASAAMDALVELYRHASLHGDPMQRVMAYFADGLAARILPEASPLYQSVMAPPTPEEEFAAFTDLYRASPYFQFAHFTANQTIMEAFEAEQQHNGGRLHVIDFDVSYGFQWPSLIQSLCDKATTSSPISLRLTGFGGSTEELEETETRLVGFCKGCSNLEFVFQGLLRGSTANDLKIDKDATLAVNLVFYLQTLKTSSEMLATLMSIRSLNPRAVVVLVEKEDSRGPASFLARMVDSLNYFAAMFHSLHDCLPAESTERLSIEKNHLGREIKAAMGKSSHQEKVGGPTWKGRMETVGYRGMKLSSRSVSQAKLLLKIRSHFSSIEHVSNSGFGIAEGDDGTTISLCWQDRNLITVSAWRCST
ncbi:unnamed protein product [Musa banksii]